MRSLALPNFSVAISDFGTTYLLLVAQSETMVEIAKATEEAPDATNFIAYQETC